MFEFISKKISDIKILHVGYTADYFLNRMKPNALFPILSIQNNLKKNQVPTFFIRLFIAHVHFREILAGYFLLSRFDWSIFVTQLVAKHMKEICNHYYLFFINFFLCKTFILLGVSQATLLNSSKFIKIKFSFLSDFN
jgi:hypothetical protein